MLLSAHDPLNTSALNEAKPSLVLLRVKWSESVSWKMVAQADPTKKEVTMVIKSVNLETVCGVTSTLPENVHPEFAFAGKSNVGKSSLINALMNRKNYARTSQQLMMRFTMWICRATAMPMPIRM